MKNFKNVIIVLIVIAVIAGGYYYVTKISKSNDNKSPKNNLNETVTNEDSQKDIKTDVQEDKNETISEENLEDIYSEVLKDYKLAKEEYDPNQVSSINSKYPLVNETLISHVYLYSKNNIGIGYTFYDIDNNGRKELIVGVTNATDNSLVPAAIYTYTSNKEIKKIYFLDTIERGNLAIYDNGVIYSNGSGGAVIHYYNFFKMSSDGNSLETLEQIREEYKSSNDVKYYNDETNKELNYKSSDEIIAKYINGSKEIKLKTDNTTIK